MKREIRAALAMLKPGTTQCPGKLSRSLGSTLKELRPTLDELERDGSIIYTQRGERVRGRNFKGPFRVALPSRPARGR